jgi:VWFA-related protein
MSARFTLLLCAVALPLGGVALLGQQQPVFRTGTDVVQLDVSVLDKNRKPIRGLTAADFSVLEDGVQQRIVAVASIDVGATSEPAVGWLRDVPADVFTNQVQGKRLFVLVLDDVMIPQEPFFIKSARQIAMDVIESLAANDLAAVVFTGDHRRSQEFTNDKARLRAALDGFNPGLAGYKFGLDSNGVDVDYAFYQGSIETLRNLTVVLAEIPNRRKAVFWISPGVPIDPSDWKPGDPNHPPGQVPPQRLPPPHMVELLQRLDEVHRLAQRANAVFYPVDPTGLGGLRNYLFLRLGAVNQYVSTHKAAMQQDVLVSTATNTGGRPILNINEFGSEIAEVFTENEVYYLVGFESSNPARDGRTRRIQVRVNRPDVEVRTRTSYVAEKPAPASSSSGSASGLREAVAGTVPRSDLPLKASFVALPVVGERWPVVTVVLGVRQPIPDAPPGSRLKETTSLLIGAFNLLGEPRGTQQHDATVTVRTGIAGEAEYEVLGRIDLAPGRYRLRLAAHHQTTGKTGSVFGDIEVPDFNGAALSATQPLLSESPGRVSAPRDLIEPLLSIVPTAERTFVPSARVTSIVRISQNGLRPIVPVNIAISVRDQEGGVVATESRTVDVDEFNASAKTKPDEPVIASSRTRKTTEELLRQQEKDQFLATLRTADVRYQVPLRALAAGEYLIRFEMTSRTETIHRLIRFAVRRNSVAR